MPGWFMQNHLSMMKPQLVGERCLRVKERGVADIAYRQVMELASSHSPGIHIHSSH